MANPGQNRLGREHWPKLEQYVRDVVGGHKDDRRIVMWDVMNEPTCTSFNKPQDKELIWTFLRHFLDYVRQVDPRHPRTVGRRTQQPHPAGARQDRRAAQRTITDSDLREDLRAVKALAQQARQAGHHQRSGGAAEAALFLRHADPGRGESRLVLLGIDDRPDAVYARGRSPTRA